MPNGDGGGNGFGGIFDPLVAALAAIIQAIIDFLVALVNALVQILNFLFEGEVGIFGFSSSGLESVFKGIKNIMDQVFKVWVVKALHHLLDLFRKLQAFVRKLKQWLDRLRKLQQVYQVQALRRFINLIQRVRKILLVFRLFHLKFAMKLDRFLSHIESLIIQRQLQFARKTNEIIGWLNLILDPVRGLSHLPAFLAVTKSADALLQVFTGHGLDFWYSKRLGADFALPPPITYKQHYNALEADLVAGTGDVGTLRAQFALMQDLMKQVR